MTTGLHTHRLRPNQNNQREVAFAEQWSWENEHFDILKNLLEVPCSLQEATARGRNGPCQYPLGIQPTERDAVIAATVIQWLGSNVGLSFIREALNKCGMFIDIKSE